MSEARTLAERHVQTFNDRAWDNASSLYAPDLVVQEPASTLHGVDAFVGMAQGFATAFPDSRMEIDVVVSSGTHAIVEGRYVGTHTGPLGDAPPTGNHLALPICIVFEAAAGRITSVHAYYDQMALAGQLGLVPA